VPAPPDARAVVAGQGFWRDLLIAAARRWPPHPITAARPTRELCPGRVGAFIAFPLLARGVMMVAARVGKPKLAALRLALANLHRPGAPTPIVMLSLGLGLTVLVATALIEGNLREQITQRIPKDAPAFFFVDIQSRQIQEFEQAIAAVPGAGVLDKVPSLRGASCASAASR
jgi:putative ABC transport system permease protein